MKIPKKIDTMIVGCGYVGMALCQQLQGMGLRVMGIKRSTVDASFPIIATDVCQETTLWRDLKNGMGENSGVDTVIYLVSAAESSPNAYRSAYVDGVRNVLAASQQLAVKRWIFVSSTSVYGNSGSELLDEESPTNPENFSGEIILQGESLVLESPFESSVVRFSGIYGPGRNRLVNQIKNGEIRLTGEPIYTNRIHRDDCVGFLVHVLGLPVLESVYIGTDSCPALKDDVVRYIAELCQVKLEAGHGDPTQKSGRRSQKRLSNQRLLGSGYCLKYPTYKEGYRDLLKN